MDTKIDLTKVMYIEQMHDEKIDEILICDKKLVLAFNELHFEHNGIASATKAKMIFSGFEDIPSDVFVDLISMKHCKITDGKRIYVDEFVQIMQKKKIKIEVEEILGRIEHILIRGVIVNPDGKYVNSDVEISICAKEITYEFE